MRKATKTAAAWFGITAGLAGIEHGYFEILQGNTRPDGMVIASIGPPCVAEEIWNACEPAMTILPNFLITGILAVIFGLMITVWSAAFIQRKNGGAVLILLSIALLLFGGGFFPPIIGVVGGFAGLKINKPIVVRSPGLITQFAARLWPWPLVIFVVWVFGQWLVGTFFNEWLQRNMLYGVSLILAMMPLSVYAAYGFDVLRGHDGG
jgi:hypothetical protein